MTMRSNDRRDVRRGSTSGFTLVELLLVVTILGVLAGVVVFQFAGVGGDARNKATRASIAAIQTAVQAYEVRMGNFPESLDALTAGNDEMPALLKKDNLNDSWGTPFQYKKTGKFEFEIRSAGEDAQMGTADDITN